MKYKIKQVRPRITALVVPDDYERAMLFWRVQEFYESPCKLFRGAAFSVWDYARWYARKYGGCFSYPKDFVGFNLPLIVAKKCYEINEVETPYDEEMKSIIDSLFVNGERGYLIGAESLKGFTFEHEMAHALYYVDDQYREEMDELTRSLPRQTFLTFKRNLAKVGYCSSVLMDEVQAYMSNEINPKLCKGVRSKKSIHKKYRAVFKRYR